jgi:hypothetical protein
MSRTYSALPGADFTESFLMKVELLEWPNDFVFVVWAPSDGACYRIVTKGVLEFHFMRTGTGRLQIDEGGLPLGSIYLTYEDEYRYWRDKIQAYAEQGYDSKADPICIEFDSHLFANRKRQDRRDKNTGLLVVCRDVAVEEDYSYSGPRPTAYRIPSDDR